MKSIIPNGLNINYHEIEDAYHLTDYQTLVTAVCQAVSLIWVYTYTYLCLAYTMLENLEPVI